LPTSPARTFSIRRRELVDRLGERRDGLNRAVLAPPGHIRHRLAVHAQADARAHQVRRGVHDHLGTLASILRIPDAEAVNCVLDEGPYLRR
jgi:hypothetical protein